MSARTPRRSTKFSFTEEALKALRERLGLLADRGIMGAEYQATLRRYEEMREIARREQEQDFNSDMVTRPDGMRVPAMEDFEERVTARRIAEERAKMDAYANAMQEQVKYGIGFVSVRDVYGNQLSPNTESIQTAGSNTSLAPVKPRAPVELPTTGINVLGKRQIEID